MLNLEQRDRGAFAEEDLLLAHVVAGQIGAAIHRCQLVGELEDAFLTTIGVISDAVELQDSYTASHANEVAELAVRVGERLGIEGAELDRLRYAALLHDVGKIGIPAEILRKPGPLTDEERGRMDEHTAIGARMLERIPFLAPVAPLVRSAHERHDGGGYPDGLAGEQIPRGAMVIATCDAFHAMTSDRSYRKAMSVTAAEAELRDHAGTQFEPSVVDGAARRARHGRLVAAEVAQHRLFGHPDQAEAAVRAHVAGADADVGAVRTDHLDDRADVTDFAFVAVVGLDRLHLLRHDFADLALVEHAPLLSGLPILALTIGDRGADAEVTAIPQHLDRLRSFLDLRSDNSRHRHRGRPAVPLDGSPCTTYCSPCSASSSAPSEPWSGRAAASSSPRSCWSSTRN